MNHNHNTTIPSLISPSKNIYIENQSRKKMEKDIDRKNPDTDIVIRIDDFGGKRGLTIREFVKSDRYTGFTKAGTRIPADKFEIFKQAINSINAKDLIEDSSHPSDKKTPGQKEVSHSEVDEEAF